MSFKENKLMSLAGADINQLSESELKIYCKELLKKKIHGICFSVYDESWKISTEGDVGAYWGIWDNKKESKFS